jgi:hypothetical protein
MSIINKELLENSNKRYISQLNYYTRSMVSSRYSVETINIEKQVQFDNTIKICYYELDDTERLEKKIMYNQIIMKVKIMNLLNE